MSVSAFPSRQEDQRGLRRPGVLAWLRLARIFNKVNRCSSEQLRVAGLSMAQFDVLAHVGSEEGMTQQQLADSLLVTKGNICQLLDRMESGGLIERRQEGRANRLYLTPTGRSLFHESVPAHEDRIADHFGALSAEEQSHLLDLLRKLDRSLS
jgi:MarR family transcriptional regulator, 2-MHQ and catechol-resistance regulon repressor